jgi:hypothetical protein
MPRSEGPTTDPCRLNAVYIVTPWFSKINFSIILRFFPKFLCGIILCIFKLKFYMHLSVSQACYMSCLLIKHPNNIC